MPMPTFPKAAVTFPRLLPSVLKVICVKQTQGGGVPSFRASDEAALSTCGRVRLLKKALNGELGELPFADQAMAHVIGTCMGCKGRKRECENAIDMTMIKIEYLAQRNAIQGTSLRTRLFGNIANWYQRLPWLKNIPALHNRYPLLAKLNERLLGITSKRSLPEPAKREFEYGEYQSSVAANDHNQVVLLLDTFTRCFNPNTAHAALTVLEAAGYHVYIAQPDSADKQALCCAALSWPTAWWMKPNNMRNRCLRYWPLMLRLDGR